MALRSRRHRVPRQQAVANAVHWHTVVMSCGRCIAVAQFKAALRLLFGRFRALAEVLDPHINAIRNMGSNQWHELRSVIMPSATSRVITGLKVSVPYPLVGIVIGELMSSNRGAIFNEGLGRLETFFLRWR